MYLPHYTHTYIFKIHNFILLYYLYIEVICFRDCFTLEEKETILSDLKSRIFVPDSAATMRLFYYYHKFYCEEETFKKPDTLGFSEQQLFAILEPKT